MIESAYVLSTQVAAFCKVLREEHDFAIGGLETHDALCAMAAIGIRERERVRMALRLVCCGTQAQTLAFDRAFDAFFVASEPGEPQAALAARHTRPGREKPEVVNRSRPGARSKPAVDEREESEGSGGQRHPPQREADEAARWQLLPARYSPVVGRGTPLEIDMAAIGEMRAAADRLVRSVRLGRSRRWKAVERGSRFDIRRTMRAGLQTGGDLVALHFLAHPFRNPRFVFLIDGSRSMAEHTAGVVTFAAALCDRVARASAFFFSTGLRDATHDLRALVRDGVAPPDLGEAWGGGTKIGANLARFVDGHGARLLSRETLVIIVSDGLDVGDVAQLARAMREIDRRSAGIVWLNPHVATPGFVPVARGMRAALPFITLLCDARAPAGFVRLAERIARTPRIRGHP